MRWLVLVFVVVGGCAREIPSAAPKGVARGTGVVARYVEVIGKADSVGEMEWKALQAAHRRGWCEMPPARADSAKLQAAEDADRIADTVPKDAKPGQSGASENAQSLQVLVRAIAQEPKHPQARAWFNAAKVYAVNVFSIAGDRTSNAVVGQDMVRKIVRTANLNSDFTLEQGGRFDPVAIAECGRLLGDAWAILKLADQQHGTNLAEEFAPYAMHHVEDTWKNVMRMMFLPDGDLALRDGFDSSAYLALVGTALRDPVASALEARWRPVDAEASASALLQHALRGTGAPVDPLLADGISAARVFRDADVWVRRNGSYFVAASWGERGGGVFRDRGGVTLPLADGILPAGVVALESARDVGDAVVAELRLKSGGRAAVVCLPNSVLWLSPEPMRAVGIKGSSREGPPTSGMWLSIDNNFGCIASAAGWRFSELGPVARLSPPPAARAWMMIAGASNAQTRAIAEEFLVQYADGVMHLTVRDGPAGRHYSIAAPLRAEVVGTGGVTVVPLD